MEKRIRSLTALILAGMVLALAAGFMAGKKQTFSENENRYLAGFPHFTWERAVSGAYMEDWSSYLADQFPFRDFFVGAKTGMEYALGKREINQVFFAGDGYLIEEYAAPVNTDRIADALHNFAEELESLQLDPRLMLVPTAYHVYREKLPAHVSWRDQMETAQTLYDASGTYRLQPGIADLWGGRAVLQDGSPLDHAGRLPGLPCLLRRDGAGTG